MSNRQWVYTERGRLSTTIKQTTGPIPDAKEGEVVIKVKAAALNPVENQMYGFKVTCTLTLTANPPGYPYRTSFRGIPGDPRQAPRRAWHDANTHAHQLI